MKPLFRRRDRGCGYVFGLFEAEGASASPDGSADVAGYRIGPLFQLHHLVTGDAVIGRALSQTARSCQRRPP